MIKGQIKTIVEMLHKSGLAADICNSKGSFKIKLRDIGRKYAFDSRHSNFPPRDSPRYYEFVKDYVKAILELNNPNGNYGKRIRITSKYFEMDEECVKEFKKAWPIVLSSYCW
jgi:hypothetical protein